MFMLTVILDTVNNNLAVLGRNIWKLVPLINVLSPNRALEIAASSIIHMQKIGACLCLSSLLWLIYHSHRCSRTMREPPLSHNVYFDIMSVFCSEKMKSALLSASNRIVSGLYNMVKKKQKHRHRSHTQFWESLL